MRVTLLPASSTLPETVSRDKWSLKPARRIFPLAVATVVSRLGATTETDPDAVCTRIDGESAFTLTLPLTVLTRTSPARFRTVTRALSLLVSILALLGTCTRNRVARAGRAPFLFVSWTFLCAASPLNCNHCETSSMLAMISTSFRSQPATSTLPSAMLTSTRPVDSKGSNSRTERRPFCASEESNPNVVAGTKPQRTSAARTTPAKRDGGAGGYCIDV